MFKQLKKLRMKISRQTVIPGVLFSGILMVIATNMPTLPGEGELAGDNYFHSTEISAHQVIAYPTLPQPSGQEPQYYPPLPRFNAVMP